MASYNTIPAAAEDSLLAPKKSNKINTQGGGVFPAARINNCVMSSGGWPSDSGHYGCPHLRGNQNFTARSC